MESPVEIRIEKGIPIPPRWGGESFTPEEQRARHRAESKRRYEQHKAAGICTWFGCPQKPAKGHVMCQPHLKDLRMRSRRRTDERNAKGLCHDCGQPAFPGLRHCLVCREKRTKSLPKIIKQGIAEFRRLEAKQEREREREELRGKIHLLDERRRRVISLRNGLDDGTDRTLQQIADTFGVTRERIRQLEKSAMYQIEHGVPLPNKGSHGKAARTLKEMQPGDSIICTANQTESFYTNARRLGYMITGRKQPDGMYRVWMVSKDTTGTD